MPSTQAQSVKQRLQDLQDTLAGINDASQLPMIDGKIPKCYSDVFDALDGDGTDPPGEPRYEETRQAIRASHAILRQNLIARSIEEIDKIMGHW